MGSAVLGILCAGAFMCGGISCAKFRSPNYCDRCWFWLICLIVAAIVLFILSECRNWTTFWQNCIALSLLDCANWFLRWFISKQVLQFAKWLSSEDSWKLFHIDKHFFLINVKVVPLIHFASMFIIVIFPFHDSRVFWRKKGPSCWLWCSSSGW